MAKFSDAYLTDAGADLIAQSITDGVKIDFIRMEIGDGEYTEEEKSKDVLRKRTSLKNKRQESSFNSVEKAKDSAVKLKAAIDNRNVTNGYRMTEIGIFAKASGDTASDGVLYSIAVAIEADYMPPESTPITYIQEFYTKVGNAENVEITVSTGVYALAEDLAELEEPTYTESEALEELTPGESLKLALGKIAKAVKEIIAHMALKATGSVTGHVKVSSSAAVTDSTGMALAATEKNASLEGTLAYKLEQLNTNLKDSVYYVDAKKEHTPASIVVISRPIAYTNGVAELDISSFRITPIIVLSANVLGSAITHAALAVTINGGTALRSVLNNTEYNGTLTTVFTVMCSMPDV